MKAIQANKHAAYMLVAVSKIKLVVRTLHRVARSIVLPYRASSAELDFVEQNVKHWTRFSNSGSDCGAILVETALSTPSSLLEKFLIAKKIEEKTRAQVIGILNAIYPQASTAYHVARSFGVSHFVCWWRGYANPLLVMRCLYKTLQLIYRRRTGLSLLNLDIEGVHIGDLIYDTLVRYRPNCYTVGKLGIRPHFRLIFRSIFNFYSTQALFRRYKIRAVVTSHNVYAEFGIMCRIAHSNGVPIFLKDMDVFRLYRAQDNVYEHFLRIKPDELHRGMVDPDIVANAEDYYNQRLNGAIDQVDLKNAFSNKQTYDKKRLLELFGADPMKKTVFVMAHAFSDAPHVGGKLAFDDYYDWLRQTLSRLSKNQSVNVIVKPHPSSYMWGEKGAVEVMLEELGSVNIHITPSDFSNISIKMIADYIVTARGTAGLEYSGLGIPAVTCGEGYYSGFGIALENIDRVAYFDMLDNIANIKPLSAEVSQRARVLLYLTFTKLSRSILAPARHIYPGDNAEILIPKHFAEISAKLKLNGLAQDSFAIDVDQAVSSAF